jgi:hypothetical protein
MPRLRTAILLCPLLFAAVPAHAITVALVRPPGLSVAMTEALVRLHGELLSVGIDVEVADGPATREPGVRAWLDTLAAKRGASAVIDPAGDAIDVWIIDKASHRFEVSRVALEPGTENAAERLAIRAIEVLRSSFLEIDLMARERRREISTRPEAAVLGEVRGPPPERFGLALGAAALTSLDGVGPALVPLVRFDVALHPRFAVQAVLAGWGSRPTVASKTGSARVGQQYGVLGGCYRFRPGQGLRPFVALAAGALRTSVEGQADLPKQGHVLAQWSFLLDGSAGIELRLFGRTYVTLAAHVHAAEPYVAIHFVDTVVATSGRPNLLVTLAVGARR